MKLSQGLLHLKLFIFGLSELSRLLSPSWINFIYYDNNNKPIDFSESSFQSPYNIDRQSRGLQRVAKGCNLPTCNVIYPMLDAPNNPFSWTNSPRTLFFANERIERSLDRKHERGVENFHQSESGAGEKNLVGSKRANLVSGSFAGRER